MSDVHKKKVQVGLGNLSGAIVISAGIACHTYLRAIGYHGGYFATDVVMILGALAFMFGD